MEKQSNLLETDIEGELLKVELQPQQRMSNQLYAPAQKCHQSTFDTLLEKLLCAVRSGNKQDQLNILSDLDTRLKILHQRTGNRQLSCIQFLAAMQRFLESQELVLCKTVQRLYRGMLRCSSPAKA